MKIVYKKDRKSDIIRLPAGEGKIVLRVVESDAATLPKVANPKREEVLGLDFLQRGKVIHRVENWPWSDDLIEFERKNTKDEIVIQPRENYELVTDDYFSIELEEVNEVKTTEGDEKEIFEDV